MPWSLGASCRAQNSRKQIIKVVNATIELKTNLAIAFFGKQQGYVLTFRSSPRRASVCIVALSYPA